MVKGEEREQWANRMMEFKFPKEETDGDTTVDTIDSDLERSLLSGRQHNVGSTLFPTRKSFGSPVNNSVASETSSDAEEEKFVMLGEGLPLTKSEEVMDVIHDEVNETSLGLKVIKILPLEDEDGMNDRKFDVSPSTLMRMGMTAAGRTFFPRENDHGFCAIDANAGHTPFPKRKSFIRGTELSDWEIDVEMTSFPEPLLDPMMNSFCSQDEKCYLPRSPGLDGVQGDLDDSDYDDETDIELLDEEKPEDEKGGLEEIPKEDEKKVEDPKKLDVKKVPEEAVVPKEKAKTWGPGHVAKMAMLFDRTIRDGASVIDPEELAKAGL